MALSPEWTERRIADVVGQGGRGDDGADVRRVVGQQSLAGEQFGELATERAANAGDLEAVGEPRPGEVVTRQREDLRLVLQAAKVAAVDDAVVVDVELVAGGIARVALARVAIGDGADAAGGEKPGPKFLFFHTHYALRLSPSRLPEAPPNRAERTDYDTRTAGAIARQGWWGRGLAGQMGRLESRIAGFPEETKRLAERGADVVVEVRCPSWLPLVAKPG